MLQILCGYETLLSHMPIDTLKNAKQPPKVYYARHFFPGVAEYEKERIQIDNAAMKKMAKSMEGCPIYVHHQDVDMDNIHNADGFVTDNFINPLDGWMWSKFIVISDDGHDAVQKGWGVSNAYVPTETSGAGTQHNVDYNRKILNGKFTHLAIVPNPRYEEAKIFTPDDYKKYNAALKEAELSNSANKTGKPIMNIFKLVKTAVKADEIDNDTMIELTDGSHKSVLEMKNEVEAAEAAKKAAAAKTATEEEKKNTKITVAGVEMTVEELQNAYEATLNAAKKKEDEDEDKDEKAKKEMKNSTETKDKADIKNFDEIANAAASKFLKASKNDIIETRADQLKRGSENY